MRGCSHARRRDGHQHRRGRTLPVLGGELQWHPLRHTLGIRAFGMNAYTAAKAGDLVVEEHDEGSLGHEEVYVVLAGRATFTLDGEEFDAPAGTVVHLADPKVKRVAAPPRTPRACSRSGPAGRGLRAVAVGARVPRRGARAGGDPEGAVAIAREALEQHPDNPSVLYNLACFEALAGHEDDAMAHLKRAIELRPPAREWAQCDDDLAALRDAGRLPEVVAHAGQLLGDLPQPARGSASSRGAGRADELRVAALLGEAVRADVGAARDVRGRGVERRQRAHRRRSARTAGCRPP